MTDRFDALVASLQKELGERVSIHRGTEILWQAAERLRTGSLGLDIATNGGIPRGMITQFMGEEAGGKTTMALKTAGVVQEVYGAKAAIAWVAVEPFDKKWANDCGCVVPFSPEELALMSPEDREVYSDFDDYGAFVLGQAGSGEDALELTLRFVASGVFHLVVVDSVAALTPMVEYEGDMASQTMGQQPRLLNRFLRKCYAVFNTRLDDQSPNKTAVLLINQVREAIGVYGHPEPQPPGGRGLRHALALNVRFKRGELLKDGEKDAKQVYGKRTKIRVEKSKVGPPYREAEFDFYFHLYGDFHPGDIDTTQEIRLWAIRAGLIQQTGNSTYEIDGQKFRGKDNVDAWLLANPEKAAALEQQVLRVYLRS